MLLASATEIDPAECQRKAARIAWVKQSVAALREAQRQMDARCTEAVDRLDEDAFNRLFEAEQAKVDAIRADIDAVVEHDKWPREMHFKCI
jgi:hypothetical protein